MSDIMGTAKIAVARYLQTAHQAVSQIAASQHHGISQCKAAVATLLDPGLWAS